MGCPAPQVPEPVDARDRWFAIDFQLLWLEMAASAVCCGKRVLCASAQGDHEKIETAGRDGRIHKSVHPAHPLSIHYCPPSVISTAAGCHSLPMVSPSMPSSACLA